MNIIEKNFKWSEPLVKRKQTKYLIIHHSAGSGTVEEIHRIHLNNGWAGIGYNFYVRRNGEIYRGRPIDVAGSHTVGYNGSSVGICFEGNYDVSGDMPDAQFQSGIELIDYIKTIYPNVLIKKHRDFDSTACPGRFFPFEKITTYKLPQKETEENKNIAEEDDNEMIYNYIDKNMPEWARPTIQKLVDKGYLKGNENGELGLNDTMLKIFVINDRAGVYDL